METETIPTEGITKSVEGNHIKILVDKSAYIAKKQERLAEVQFLIGELDAKKTDLQTEADAIKNELNGYK